MASSSSPAPKLSYQKLKHDDIWLDEEENFIRRLRQSSARLRRPLPIRRKLRVKIPTLKRFLRRKARQVKGAWTKVCKRLKESRSHFSHLFAGNYLFMQVTPSPLQYAAASAVHNGGGGGGGGGNSNYKCFAKPHHLNHHHHHHHVTSLYSSSSLSSVARIA